MPYGLCGPRAFVWRFTIFRRSTVARPSPANTRMTLPVLPRSFPVITITVSFFRMCACIVDFRSQDLGGEGENLHEFLRPQFARHRTKDSGADRFTLIVDE